MIGIANSARVLSALAATNEETPNTSADHVTSEPNIEVPVRKRAPTTRRRRSVKAVSVKF